MKSKARSRVIVVGAVGFVVVLAAGWSLFRKAGILGMPGLGDSQTPALGLQVETRGSFLLVSWNRDHPLLKTSKSGLLTVLDGDFPKQEIPLDATQLETGDFVYATVSDRVLFRLEVGRDQKTAESVLAILKGRPRPKPTGDLVEDAPNPAVSPSEVQAETQSEPQPTDPAPVEAAGPATQPEVARPVRTFVPPSGNRPAEQPTRTVYLDPPSVQAAPSVPSSSQLTAISQSNAQAPPPPPPAPESAKPKESSPLISRPPAQVQAPPAKPEQRPASATYIQPSPIRQVPPTVAPQILRALVNKDTLVEVKAYVNASGKVTRAEVVSGSIHSFITNAALDAARKWTFAPARVDGNAVDGEAKIVFLFRPPQGTPGR